MAARKHILLYSSSKTHFLLYGSSKAHSYEQQLESIFIWTVTSPIACTWHKLATLIVKIVVTSFPFNCIIQLRGKISVLTSWLNSLLLLCGILLLCTVRLTFCIIILITLPTLHCQPIATFLISTLPLPPRVTCRTHINVMTCYETGTGNIFP